MNNRKRWTDKLPVDVYNRLCNCHSKRDDIEILVTIKWNWMIEKGKKDIGFTKEDALLSILELLECNNQFFDLSRDEYHSILCG